MQVKTSDCEIVLEFDRRLPDVSANRVRALATAISAVDGVTSVRLSWFGTPRIAATYDIDSNVVSFLRRVASALRNSDQKPPKKAVEHQPTRVSRRNRVKAFLNVQKQQVNGKVHTNRPGLIGRVFYGSLACNSCALAIVGIIVPGLPTIPFVILTVYFANKTSPFIQRALFKSPFIGQIMRDLRDHHGVRREVRIRELLFTCAIVLVTLIMVTPSVFTYATIAVMATLSLYLIFMIPVIDENEVEPSNANDVRSIILPIRFPANEVGWQTGI